MAFRSSAIATTNAGGNLTATPSGVAAGDYLSGWYSQDGTPPNFTVTVPTGWTEEKTLDEQALPDGAYIRYADKIAAGGDSFTFTTNDTTHEAALICAAHSGRAQTSPASFITSSSLTTLGTSPLTASITGGTAASADDLLVYVVADNPVAGVWSFTPPANPIGHFILQQNGSSGSFVSMSLATLDNFAGGATGSISEILTKATNQTGWYAVVAAIKSAPVVVAWLRV
jgi:hypothetical protein